ncbi:MAG: hypothetical protein VW576_10040 [Opitutae bacterium]
MYSKQFSESKKKSKQGSIIHKHVYRTLNRVYFIYSSKVYMDWDNFLINGMICSNISRFVELSRDEFGIQRVVRDVRR